MTFLKKSFLVYDMHLLLGIVQTKFKLNLTFVQIFIQFVKTKDKNLNSFYNVCKHKI